MSAEDAEVSPRVWVQEEWACGRDGQHGLNRGVVLEPLEGHSMGGFDGHLGGGIPGSRLHTPESRGIDYGPHGHHAEHAGVGVAFS